MNNLVTEQPVCLEAPHSVLAKHIPHTRPQLLHRAHGTGLGGRRRGAVLHAHERVECSDLVGLVSARLLSASG